MGRRNGEAAPRGAARPNRAAPEAGDARLPVRDQGGKGAPQGALGALRAAAARKAAGRRGARLSRGPPPQGRGSWHGARGGAPRGARRKRPGAAKSRALVRRRRGRHHGDHRRWHRSDHRRRPRAVAGPVRRHHRGHAGADVRREAHWHGAPGRVGRGVFKTRSAQTVPALPIEPEVDDDARLWPDDADDGVRKTPIELSRSKRKKKPPRSPSRGKDGKDDAMATAATPKRLKKKALAGSKSQPSQLTSSTSQRILAGSDDAGAAVPAPARAAAAAWCTGDFVLYARGDSTTERKMRVAACTIVDGVVAHLTIVGDGDRVETVPQFVRLAHRAWTDGAEEGRPIVDGGSAGVGYRRRTLVARGGAGVGDGAGASDGARTSDAAASRIQAHARRGAAQRAIERERRLRDDQGPAVTTLQARLRGRAARGVPARRSSAAATIQAHARGRQRRSPRASSDARGVNADVARDAAATRPQARSRAFLAMHERHRHRSATTLQAAMRARAATRKAAAMRTAAARGAARDITLSVCNTTFVARYAISQLSSV
ncbi:hypothetical protein M885DRAFT_105947 [Pelagophyceae sp. CCMP2097]|nr:hypothetical protein M885DRAFT_105947 [Pelagophyceae sp. CCMP2097]